MSLSSRQLISLTRNSRSLRFFKGNRPARDVPKTLRRFVSLQENDTCIGRNIFRRIFLIKLLTGSFRKSSSVNDFSFRGCPFSRRDAYAHANDL